MTDFRWQITEEIRKIVKTDYFKEIADLLLKTKQYLRIDYIENMDGYANFPRNEWPTNVCFIYSDQVFENLETLYKDRLYKENLKIYNANEFAQDLASIYLKVKNLARLGHLERIRPIIENQSEKYIIHPPGAEEESSVLFYLRISLLNLEIVTIHPYLEDQDEDYWEDNEPPDFKKIIHEQTTLPFADITDNQWFGLSSKQNERDLSFNPKRSDTILHKCKRG
jgi:hypothetical protein